MDLLQTYRRSLNEFTDRVAQVGPDQWTAPTPCADWDVRTLVNHVVREDRWAVPLFAGATVEDVGDALEGDQLGGDPVGAAREAAAAAEMAVSESGALSRTIALSRGSTPAREYVHELLTEHLIHGWDLAVAIGAEPRLDAEAVHECAVWFAGRESSYRDAGLIASRTAVSSQTREQDRLLAAFGRDPTWRRP